MKIGIYGGAFNPPHIGHKQIVLDLLKFNYLDKVICVPVGDKYFKQDLSFLYHRVRMLEIMFEGNPDILISDYENQNKVIYTYQTLDYFKALYPEDDIYFICGSDNIKEINTWKNYKYILSNYKILVVLRAGYNLETVNSPSIIITNIMTKNISSTEIRDKLDDKNISEGVRKYIDENRLYCH